ncbi:MAG TPA: hypothetical protein VF758_07790 [Candidatus Acidoferrum sp.]
MNRAPLAILLGVLLLSAGACKKTDDKEALRAGIVKHLSAMQGLNISNMDIVVTKATVNGNQATASVDIKAKTGEMANAPAMQLTYTLEKQADGWVVVKGQPTGGMQHPTPGQATPDGSLPPGHPATSGGHSDFNEIMNSTPPPQQAPAQQPTAPAKP